MTLRSATLEPLRANLLDDVIEFAVDAHRRRERWADPGASLLPDSDLATAFEGILGEYLDDPDRHLVLAIRDGRIVAALGGRAVRLEPHEDAFTYMPPRHFAIPLTGVLTGGGSAAASALPALYAHVRAHAASQGLDMVTLGALGADWHLGSVLRTLGLRPNTTFALRRVDLPARRSAIPLRPAVHEDLDRIVDLYAEEQRFHIAQTRSGMSPDQDRATLERIVSGWFDHEAPETTERAFVAVLAGEVVGVSTVHVITTPPSVPPATLFPLRYAYVGMTCVTARVRGMGVGSALAANAVRWTQALAQPPDAIGLHYVCDNPLSSVFWPRQGYAPVMTTMSDALEP